MIFKKEIADVSECDIIKIKMRRDLSDTKSETYELKIATFENGQAEEFLALMKNFKTALDGKGTTSAAGKINYLRTILRGEALQEVDKTATQNTRENNEHLKFIQEGLLGYYPPD